MSSRKDEIALAANWWLALIIMVVLNGIYVWTVLFSLSPVSKKGKRGLFIAINVVGLILAISQFFWMDFSE